MIHRNKMYNGEIIFLGSVCTRNLTTVTYKAIGEMVKGREIRREERGK